MRSIKPVLFILAGAWVVLLLIEKITGTTGSIAMRKRFLPVRWGYHLVHGGKSMLMALLAVMNVFLAIAMVDHKGK
jgi:hypothetical protein